MDKLANLCHRYRIRRLSLFGSVLRDDFRPESDVDILVEYHPDARNGLKVIDIQDDLSKLFGHRVDLVNRRFLHPLLRDKVLAAEVVQFDDA